MEACCFYSVAKEFAKQQGIIIADTKFEFGLDEETDEVVLVDEVLTPDSSRFWSAKMYELGRSQDSFDKQFLRNWLTSHGLKGKEGVASSINTGSSNREQCTIVTRMLAEFDHFTGNWEAQWQGKR